MNPREQGELFSAMTGTDEKTTEAFTRFLTTGHAGGWNSLTQDDFAMLEDAINDSWDRPRRRRKNPLVWKIGFWWHWHITSPLDDGARWLAWHILPHACRLIVHVAGESCVADDISFTATRLRARWTTRHYPQATFTPIIHGLYHLELPDEAAADAYCGKYHSRDDRLPMRYRIADRLGRLHSGWVWDCPDCGIDFADPGDTLSTETEAAAALYAHAETAHAGMMPGTCGVTQILWT